MTVGVGEIGNNVPCWLVDAPVQPCSGWDNTILAPSSVIGKFVDVMDMDIGRLTPHRFEFGVEIVRQAFDGQKTALVPESIIMCPMWQRFLRWKSTASQSGFASRDLV